MPLATCPRCKKLFSKTETPVCPSCNEAEEADYKKVREILDAQPGLTPEQVSKEADVDVAVVNRMLKDGVLEFAEKGGSLLCGRCGKAPAMSASKRLCQPCLDALNAQVAQATSQIRLGDKKQAQVGEYLSARKTFDDRRGS